MIPIYGNHALPIRPPPATSARNYSVTRLYNNEIPTENIERTTPDGMYNGINNIDSKHSAELNDTNRNMKMWTEVPKLRYSSTSYKDEPKNCINFKRKLQNVQEKYPKNRKNKQHSSNFSENKKKEDKITKLDDVMRIKIVKLQTSADRTEFSKTPNEELNNGTGSTSPLKLKKVVQEVTIDQHNHVEKKKKFSPEMEVNNYKLISEKTPTDDTTQGLVSTKSKSKDTSFIPKSYVDNIRITIPSLSDVGIQESYEITGPNFIATMTSKITNAKEQSSNLSSSLTHYSPIWGTRKLKEKVNISSNSSSTKTCENSSINPRSTSDYIPNITLSKPYESLNQNLNRDPSPFVNENKMNIKLMKIPEESFDEYESKHYNTPEEELNNCSRNDTETKNEPKLEQNDVGSLNSMNQTLLKNNEHINNNKQNLNSTSEKLQFGRNRLQLKLIELKNKAIELQNTKDIQHDIYFQRTLNFYEKQIESISKFIKKLTPNENNLNLNYERKYENVQNFDVQKKVSRSPSLSPPRLSPTSPINYERVKSPSEIRNSPPVLQRIHSSFHEELENNYESRSTSNQSSLSLTEEDYNNSNDKALKNIINDSPIANSININDENYLEKSTYHHQNEVYDDEQIEITVLKKAMNKGDVKINNSKCFNEPSTIIKHKSRNINQSISVMSNNVITSSANNDVSSHINKALHNNTYENQFSDDDFPTLESWVTKNKQIYSERNKMRFNLEQKTKRNNHITSQINESIGRRKFKTHEFLECSIPLKEQINPNNKSTIEDELIRAPDLYQPNTIDSNNFDDNPCYLPNLNKIRTSPEKTGNNREDNNNSFNMSMPSLYATNDIKKNQASYLNSINTAQCKDHLKENTVKEIANKKEKPKIINDSIIYPMKCFHPLTSHIEPPDLSVSNKTSLNSIENNNRSISNTFSVPVVCTKACMIDTNFRAKFSATSTTSLTDLYSLPPRKNNCSLINIINNIQFEDARAKLNSEPMQINTSKDFNDTTMLVNNKSRHINASKSAVSHNLVTSSVNSNVPSFTNKTLKNIKGRKQITADQFPTLGYWISKNNRNLEQNMRKSNLVQNTDLNSHPESQNMELNHLKYMIDNTSYNSRWNKKESRDMQPSQHLKYFPIQNTVIPSHQGFLSTTSKPQYFSEDYSVHPYAMLSGYNSTYPFSPTLPYSSVPIMSNIGRQQTTSNNMRSLQHPAVLQSDKQNLSGFKNLTEFLKFQRAVAIPAINRYPDERHAEFLKSCYNNYKAYNNYTLTEPAYASPINREINYNKRETQSSQIVNEETCPFSSMKPSRLPKINSLISFPTDQNNLPVDTNSHDSASYEIPKTLRSKAVMKSANNSPKIECLNCGATNNLFQCFGCELAYYCNKVCQAQHWNEHALNCSKFILKSKEMN